MTGARAPYPAHARRVVWPEVARTSGPEVARVRACAFWPMARGRFCIPTKILGCSRELAHAHRNLRESVRDFRELVRILILLLLT